MEARLVEEGEGDGGEGVLGEGFKIDVTIKYERGMALRLVCTNGYLSGLSFEQPIMPLLVERTDTLTYVFLDENKIAG